MLISLTHAFQVTISKPSLQPSFRDTSQSKSSPSVTPASNSTLHPTDEETACVPGSDYICPHLADIANTVGDLQITILDHTSGLLPQHVPCSCTIGRAGTWYEYTFTQEDSLYGDIISYATLSGNGGSQLFRVYDASWLGTCLGENVLVESNVNNNTLHWRGSVGHTYFLVRYDPPLRYPLLPQ